MKTTFGVGLVILILCSTGLSFAQEKTLSVTEMKAYPAVVKPGRKVLISCRATDTRGPMFILRVAAMAKSADFGTSFPVLFDDGTNGDKTSRDGVYSLKIIAPKKPGEVKVFFYAVSTDRQEVESETVTFTVR
jgi:hypothetical protein